MIGTLGPWALVPVAVAILLWAHWPAIRQRFRGLGAGRERLISIHGDLLSLLDAWESGFPAGKEAWRTRVAVLVDEAAEIIRTTYSQKEASAFRSLRPSDAKDYEPNREEPWDREFLLSAQIGFIYRVVYGEPRNLALTVSAASTSSAPVGGEIVTVHCPAMRDEEIQRFIDRAAKEGVRLVQWRGTKVVFSAPSEYLAKNLDLKRFEWSRKDE